MVEPKVKAPQRPSKLDPFAETLSGWLKIEAGKSRRQKRTAKQMHTDLVARGSEGSYRRVALFVRRSKADRQREAQTSGRGTFMPLVFASGEAFQFDWSEDWALIAGERVKLQGGAHQSVARQGIHRTSLSASDPRDAVRCADPGAFRVPGGVPRLGIFDNINRLRFERLLEWAEHGLQIFGSLQ